MVLARTSFVAKPFLCEGCRPLLLDVSQDVIISNVKFPRTTVFNLLNQTLIFVMFDSYKNGRVQAADGSNAMLMLRPPYHGVPPSKPFIKANCVNKFIFQIFY